MNDSGALKEDKNADGFISADQFFTEAVDEAIKNRGIETNPLAQQYLANLLSHYLHTDNLYSIGKANGKPLTLAETFLLAHQSEASQKMELLKHLGDTSLYISGFFGDSLKRKLVDIDYYADIGCSAYASLADEDENSRGMVYKEIAERFMDFVDLLTYISQKSFIQTNGDLLRLYDRYITTGSELARDELMQKGLLNTQLKKASRQ